MEITSKMEIKDYFITETTFSWKKLPAFQAVDPMSALTHFIAFLCCIPALPVLLIRAALCGAGMSGLISLSIYMITMMMLYGASTAYHTFNTSGEVRKRLKKLDHFMIYMMIAGSYTPMCTMVLGLENGGFLLALVWFVVGIGFVQTMFFIDCKKWVSSIIYIVMGWLALLVLGRLYATMPVTSFGFLVAGGVLYTVGGVIYAFKFRLPGKLSESFGAHELFHVFVMLGSLMHYVMMYSYTATC